MNDLISRQAAIELVKDVCDAIMSGCKSHYDSEVEDEVYDDILEVDAILRCNKGIRNALRDMPSAQPERKKGRWISRDGEEDCYECSECHAVIEGDEVYWRNNYFCYHCGADMRGEDDETD